MKKIIVSVTVLCALLVISGCVSSSGTKEMAVEQEGTAIFENFEGDHYWMAVGNSWNDGDGSRTVKTSKQNATSGEKSLECKFKFKDVLNKEMKNKAATYQTKEATFYTDAPAITDWSAYKNLIVDVTNATDTELEFACAICTGTDWLWINSDVYPLKPGLNKDFTFDLTAKTYKSAVTDWENTGTLMDMDDVKRVVFRISGPVGFEGTAYIDNIRLVE